MKRILSKMIIANALIIVTMSSCEKENLSPGSTSGNTTPITQPNTTTYVVAGHWVKDANGIYVNTFQGVISPANTSNRLVRIYLVTNVGKEVQINNFISFMGGELWATHTETDVQINYRAGNQPLPFSYLPIKIVIG